MIGFELIRVRVSERLVDSLRVVERDDVFEDASPGIFEVGERGVVRLFVLERPEESFHDGVVVA